LTYRLKIKLVTPKQNPSSVQRVPSPQASEIRPYTHRVVRDHGGGLWSLEDNGGQLYLAVLSRENSEMRRERIEEEAASGARYGRVRRGPRFRGRDSS
jgi:hypothetical protein